MCHSFLKYFRNRFGWPALTCYPDNFQLSLFQIHAYQVPVLDDGYRHSGGCFRTYMTDARPACGP